MRTACQILSSLISSGPPASLRDHQCEKPINVRLVFEPQLAVYVAEQPEGLRECALNRRQLVNPRFDADIS